ncbi:MAG TPA: gephyrin-like molybdotransferase Glp [Dehalococcoidia bacterium]
MISVEEALNKILSRVEVLDSEKKSLLDCLGQVLAEDVYSDFNVPAYDNSAMDGYAAKAESIKGASGNEPMALRIIGEVAAGRIPDVRVEQGTAVRIMTGAIIPAGADVVVPYEETDEAERKREVKRVGKIGIRNALATGCNIRRRGEDIAKGELVLKKGKVLGPAEIGVLASMGKSSIFVIRRPRVGILATGDEVVDIVEPLPEGKIYNSNSYSLAAEVTKWGGVPNLLGVARDDVKQLTHRILSATDCDMLITSGGVSMGDYDVVREVLAAEGKEDFWTVNMKPGKPLAFGMLKCKNGKTIPHLGLPGNPVSSMITFEIFARPAILKMMGRSDSAKSNIEAVMEDPVTNKDGRRIFTRVVVTRRNGKYFAHTTGPQGSGILTSMTKANGLAIVPENIVEVQTGDTVEVMMLEDGVNC